MLALLAALLAFAYATLSLRRLFQGEFIGSWREFGQVETYAYSALWLALGVALLVGGLLLKSQVLRLASGALIVIAVAKVFLFDMSELEGVLRALSFIGLGVVLIGIGLFYQRMLRLGARRGYSAAAGACGSKKPNMIVSDTSIALMRRLDYSARQFVVGRSQGHQACLVTAVAMDDRRQAIIDEIPRMRRYARSLLRDRDAADDLVQDSLERALSRMESWTTGDSPRRWLFTIMHHLFVDQLRRAKRHVQVVAMMPETIDAVGRRRRRSTTRSTSREVLSALQQISPERRAALALVAVEGFSYAEAANVLGIPAGTLMSRMARGSEELRSILDDVSRRKMIKVVDK